MTYVPAPDANGVHTVTYTVGDGTGRSDTATVTVAVTAVNDAPGFVPGSDVTVAEDCRPHHAGRVGHRDQPRAGGRSRPGGRLHRGAR